MNVEEIKEVISAYKCGSKCKYYKYTKTSLLKLLYNKVDNFNRLLNKGSINKWMW